MALEVLVVDDEADIRELVSGVLEDEGYAVRTAADSDSTLDAVEERRPSMVLLDVLDTGIGLPEDRERLTEPYMTTRVRGTGLGLAIVKKIVQEHMGEIAFLDRPGGGTHVRISFDTAKLAALADDEQGSGEPTPNDEEI